MRTAASKGLLHEPLLLDARGRQLVEALAVLAAGTILKAHAPAAVADAFIASRFSGGSKQTYGQGLERADTRAILARASRTASERIPHKWGLSHSLHASGIIQPTMEWDRVNP